MAQKLVYRFGQKITDGTAAMKNLLGGKGANLAEMANLGLPVPPGFTITTEVCSRFYAAGNRIPDALKPEVMAALKQVEAEVGARFGDKDNPLLVSIRSGARASMPGMMDTVLNLGLNDETVQGLSRHSQNDRFAQDSYRRFIQMYSSVVLNLDHADFEDILGGYKEDKAYASDTEMTAEDWKHIIGKYKVVVEKHTDEPFPQKVEDQLWGAIGAVFKSWNSARANTYRKLNNIPHEWGTAVNVQAMVFGNMGDQSATGVAFTRNPANGDRQIFGEFLINAQGEDVVAGIRTPQNLTRQARLDSGSDAPSLEELMPERFVELRKAFQTLEDHFHDMQDMEFTIQQGRLWMLQTRNGKRTTAAALKIAVDMAHEGLIDEETAVMRIDPLHLDQLLHPTLDPRAPRELLGAGLPASPGAASGEIVFDATEAERLRAMDRNVILVRIETTPEDIHGMHASEGVLTTRGGMTSHAAVVARGMGKPCVSGAGTLKVNYREQTLTAGNVTLHKGDLITVDGTTGQIFKGAVATVKPALTGDFATLMGWADKFRRMHVRANAETPEDARHAREFGAEGIGLCRTEHMFFDAERIVAMREMILADREKDRRAALAKILPMQRGDFVELFEIMAGLPVTIRLLDPPLHEFLPHADHEIEEVAEAMHKNFEVVRSRVSQLHEFNPMLGHRGVRLAVTYPEIAEMQARAIFEAAVEVSHKTGGKPPVAEVMIPLVSTGAEFDLVKERIVAVAEAVSRETGVTVPYLVGTMIELPRAALRAGEIAEHAEFFSFGTNDLTQTTFGISRDDAARFIGEYTAKGIFRQDPFISLDVDGVGELVKIAAERGRASRKGLKLGICGEHGGDPASIAFCDSVGLDYVSCSPFRVPVARLAAAQASIRKSKEKLA
jgi:pyruvate,orthophosphate dikinase